MRSEQRRTQTHGSNCDSCGASVCACMRVSLAGAVSIVHGAAGLRLSRKCFTSRSFLLFVWSLLTCAAVLDWTYGVSVGPGAPWSTHQHVALEQFDCRAADEIVHLNGGGPTTADLQQKLFSEKHRLVVSSVP